MISIGLTGWGDHIDLYEKPAQGSKLQMYSSHFPIVECDSSFYAILPEHNYVKWIRETPRSFQFIVKAYQGMTGHKRDEKLSLEALKELIFAFKASVQPLISSGKLGMVLFQYPPWFDCKKDNIQLLRYTRELMGDLPVALEFRNQTWFAGEWKDRTLRFMCEEKWIHSVCDEPQEGSGSVPIVPISTDKKKVLVRLHGRNTAGWVNKGQDNWREVRYLYRYNLSELIEWKERLLDLKKQAENVYVVFNNNSGGDAAHNAKQLVELMGIQYSDLAPKQLKLF